MTCCHRKRRFGIASKLPPAPSLPATTSGKSARRCFEDTALFARGVGEETDIVSKEMYTWEDRARAQSEKTQSLTLRPENTAGVVRAYIEHQLGETGQLQKLYYIGPQFRRERPQKGRYRQFSQIGAEVIGPPSAGSESPIRDAEVLEMLATLLDELGITGWTLELNSVGSPADRARYNEALRAALVPVVGQMCEDCQRRAVTNPLRVLDCKVPADQPIIDTLPVIADSLDEASKAHFAAVLAALDAAGVPYTRNHRLVRGLDYYTRTTFEFTHGGLGAQNALLGGGRYDGLSEAIGGPKAPGIGFAMGEDRLVLTLQALETAQLELKGDAFIAPLGEGINPAALALAKELRAAGLRIELGRRQFPAQKILRSRRQDRPRHRHPGRRRAEIRYPDCEDLRNRRTNQGASRRAGRFPRQARARIKGQT